jgi:hypothetical protein
MAELGKGGKAVKEENEKVGHGLASQRASGPLVG